METPYELPLAPRPAPLIRTWACKGTDEGQLCGERPTACPPTHNPLARAVREMEMLCQASVMHLITDQHQIRLDAGEEIPVFVALTPLSPHPSSVFQGSQQRVLLNMKNAPNVHLCLPQ